MKRNLNAFGIIAPIVLFLLAGCSTVASTTLTPTSATTIQPTTPKTPTETAPPTLTPLPPMTTDNAVDVMADFLKHNGGCQLPCLFGLTPGISGPESVDTLIEYFQRNTMETENLTMGQSINQDSGSAYLLFLKNDEQVRSSMSYYYDDEEKLDVLTLNNIAAFTNTTPSQGDYFIGLDAPYGIELLQNYSLPNILALYGQPSQILIASFPTDPNRPQESYPFSLVLFYKEKGFLAEYISLRREQAEYFMGCQPTSYIIIESWSPDKQKSLSEAVVRIGTYGGINTLNIDFFKDLEEATEFTISEFYEEFKSFDAPKCILTPKELWPEPVLNP